MRNPLRRIHLGLAGAALVASLLPAGVALAAVPQPAPTHHSTSTGTKDVCGPAHRGYARCLSIIRTGLPHHAGLFLAGQAPQGYGPASLQSAYKLPSATAGAGQTVAVVDAYDDPNAEADLAVYRQQYGLPPCTTANGCFRKVNQFGTTGYPTPDAGWAGEISLDLDMVSATCPKCHILLVEASSEDLSNLGAAVNEAVALGAKYVSNSYGGGLDPATEAAADAQYYNHPGVVVTAASGDSGYNGGQYPAASPDVVAVGGTTLTSSPGSARGWTEATWSGTGSGCSTEPKPAWQHDTGCAHRTVNDVSAVADPNTGVATYDTYQPPGSAAGWQVFGGTSVSSPIIASTYALAGPPSPVAAPASYLYADPAALNDVTSGSNGTCSPAYLCTAGPGYDGPTGLGTPNGVDAFTYGVHGPHGTITGTITDKATGKPLAGAQVAAGGYTAIADAAGRYQLNATPGRHDLRVTEFGYTTTAVPGVTVTVGQSVTANVSLSAAPMETIGGTVTDGSGHGWPLAAKLTVSGTPVVGYSNPATGAYSIKLPANGSYPVRVSAVHGGYQVLNETVAVAGGGVTKNFAVPVDAFACAAPGYGSTALLSQTFDKPALPAGWSVTNFPDDGANVTWRFDQPDGTPNLTGGTGNYATGYRSSSDYPQKVDTALVTPPIDLSKARFPELGFDQFASHSMTVESVELSTDGGHTWSTAWTSDPNNGGSLPLQPASIPLPQVAGKPAVLLRFHMLSPPEAYLPTSTVWQIDNVTVTNCGPTAGGLLIGQVRDTNTGRGVDGATITGYGPTAQSTVTAAVPGDPWLSDGSYSAFAPAGSHQLTITAPGYVTRTGPASVTADRVTRADFTLDAGRLSVTPGAITATQTLGGHSTATFTVTNTGSAPVTVGLEERSSGYAQLGTAAHGADLRSAPLQRIEGRFAPDPFGHRAVAERSGIGTAPAFTDTTPWAPVASLPQALYGSAAATDPVTGRVYLAGGAGGTATSLSVDNLWMYDPHTNRWSQQPPMGPARFGAQAAYINGKFYVTGGLSSGSVAETQTGIYDPNSRTWTTGAPVPRPYFGAATTVLNGKMYIIGGCVRTCQSDVQVYDPATDSWSSAASYPAAYPAELGCGTIAGKIYCAGGWNYGSGSRAAYVYDPVKNAWSPIASMPADLWGSAYSAADGQLLLSGGVTASSTVLTNAGYAYDPATNTWSALPNAPFASYEATGACGSYRIGGAMSPDFVVGNGAVGLTSAAQLPGYGDCGGHDWVSAAPGTLSLAPGKSATVTVALSATAPAVTQPGTYSAVIRLGNTTPYTAPTIPVSYTVNPPSSWGEITGTVTGRSCTGHTAPLAGASVQIDGTHGSWPLTTDYTGHYQLWLEAAPLTFIATQSGWQSQAGSVTLQPGHTTTHNITLAAVGCG